MADDETTDGEAAETAPDAEAPEPIDPGPMLYGVQTTEHRGQTVLHPPADQWVATAEALKDDGYLMCLDVTAVDYLAHPGRDDLPPGLVGERFEVVATFISHPKAERIRMRTQVPGDDPVVPSLFDVHPGTEALEREVFDLMGITFDGHPDMSRILMPEDWQGHPLRKDYDVGRIPVQFKDAPSRR